MLKCYLVMRDLLCPLIIKMYRSPVKLQRKQIGKFDIYTVM